MVVRLNYLDGLLNVKCWMLMLILNTTIMQFVEKYLFADVGYLKWLVIAMIVDLITGITKVWKNDGWEKITSKGLRDTVSKCIQYGGFLVITHVLTHFEVNGQIQNTGLMWMNKLAYEFLILIEGKSCYENIVKINPKIDFVKFLIEKITSQIKNKE